MELAVGVSVPFAAVPCPGCDGIGPRDSLCVPVVAAAPCGQVVLTACTCPPLPLHGRGVCASGAAVLWRVQSRAGSSAGGGSGDCGDGGGDATEAPAGASGVSAEAAPGRREASEEDVLTEDAEDGGGRQFVPVAVLAHGCGVVMGASFGRAVSGDVLCATVHDSGAVVFWSGDDGRALAVLPDAVPMPRPTSAASAVTVVPGAKHRVAAVLGTCAAPVLLDFYKLTVQVLPDPPSALAADSASAVGGAVLERGAGEGVVVLQVSSTGTVEVWTCSSAEHAVFSHAAAIPTSQPPMRGTADGDATPGAVPASSVLLCAVGGSGREWLVLASADGLTLVQVSSIAYGSRRRRSSVSSSDGNAAVSSLSPSSHGVAAQVWVPFASVNTVACPSAADLLCDGGAGFVTCQLLPSEGDYALPLALLWCARRHRGVVLRVDVPPLDSITTVATAEVVQVVDVPQLYHPVTCSQPFGAAASRMAVVVVGAGQRGVAQVRFESGASDGVVGPSGVMAPHWPCLAPSGQGAAEVNGRAGAGAGAGAGASAGAATQPNSHPVVDASPTPRADTPYSDSDEFRKRRRPRRRLGRRSRPLHSCNSSLWLVPPSPYSSVDATAAASPARVLWRWGVDDQQTYPVTPPVSSRTLRSQPPPSPSDTFQDADEVPPSATALVSPALQSGPLMRLHANVDGSLTATLMPSTTAASTMTLPGDSSAVTALVCLGCLASTCDPPRYVVVSGHASGAVMAWQVRATAAAGQPPKPFLCLMARQSLQLGSVVSLAVSDVLCQGGGAPQRHTFRPATAGAGGGAAASAAAAATASPPPPNSTHGGCTVRFAAVCSARTVCVLDFVLKPPAMAAVPGMPTTSVSTASLLAAQALGADGNGSHVPVAVTISQRHVLCGHGAAVDRVRFDFGRGQMVVRCVDRHEYVWQWHSGHLERVLAPLHADDDDNDDDNHGRIHDSATTQPSTPTELAPWLHLWQPAHVPGHDVLLVRVGGMAAHVRSVFAACASDPEGLASPRLHADLGVCLLPYLLPWGVSPDVDSRLRAAFGWAPPARASSFTLLGPGGVATLLKPSSARSPSPSASPSTSAAVSAVLSIVLKAVTPPLTALPSHPMDALAALSGLVRTVSSGAWRTPPSVHVIGQWGARCATLHAVPAADHTVPELLSACALQVLAAVVASLPPPAVMALSLEWSARLLECSAATGLLDAATLAKGVSPDLATPLLSAVSAAVGAVGAGAGAGAGASSKTLSRGSNATSGHGGGGAAHPAPSSWPATTGAAGGASSGAATAAATVPGLFAVQQQSAMQRLHVAVLVLSTLALESPGDVSIATCRRLVHVLLSLISTGSPPDQLLAATLLGKGFALWRPNLSSDDLTVLVHHLVVVSASGGPPGDQAAAALLQIGMVATHTLVSLLQAELTRASIAPAHRRAALATLAQLASKAPAAVMPLLGAVVACLLKALDPRDAKRSHALREAGVVLRALLRHYPMTAYNKASNRLALGSLDAVVSVYDLHTASTWRVFKGHTGPVCAVSFNATGDALVSYSAVDASVRVWQVASSGLFASFVRHGRCLHQLPVPALDSCDVGSHSAMFQCSVAWGDSDTKLRLKREDGSVCVLAVPHA